MALDIVLWAPTKADMATWAATHPANNPLWQDGEPRAGVIYCWWGGHGQFRTGGTKASPVYAPGVVAIVRFDRDFFFNDKIDDLGREGREQWQYSKAAAWIKENGIPGTTPQGVNYHEVDGIRLFRPDDVLAFLEANNIAGHTWVDGCEY